MAGARPLLLSDVDDTLLDGRTPMNVVAAGWAAVASRIEVVLVSSRTLGELLYLLADLDAEADLIAENGGCIAVRSAAVARALGATESLTRKGRRWYVTCRARPAGEVLAMVYRARAQHTADVRLAEELPLDRRAQLLGTDRYRARLALKRRCSVLVEPPPNTSTNAAWLRTLRRAGCQTAVGGRWLAVWRGPDKGDAARAYLAARRLMDLVPPRVAAVGDASNDEPLLAAVPTRLVVRRPDGQHDRALLAVPGAVPLPAAGHAGWRLATTLLLDQCALPPPDWS